MPEVTLACIGGRWGGRDDIIYDHVDLAAARILYVFNVARLHWWLGLHADLPQTFRHTILLAMTLRCCNRTMQGLVFVVRTK